MPVRLSLCLDPGRPWPEVQALAQRVDAAGWHALYVCDHFMPNDPAGAPLDGPVLECWTTLAALSAQTTTSRLGSLVLANTYRHPAVVAKMAATLDVVSEGRVVLGVGAGWQPNEHAAYGLSMPSVAERIRLLDEACGVIRTLFEQSRSTVKGDAYQITDAPCDPKPVQERLPLLVGGGGERLTLPLVARHADVWHTWADLQTFTHKNVLLDRCCADIGRDPAEILRATGGTVSVWSEQPSMLGPVDDDVRGTVGEVLEQLTMFRRAGADEFIVRDDAKSVSLERALAQIDLLSDEVLPALALT